MVVVANPLSNHAQVSITPYHLLRKLGGQDVIFLKARIWKVSFDDTPRRIVSGSVPGSRHRVGDAGGIGAILKARACFVEQSSFD
jgi:hypothetical protein